MNEDLRLIFIWLCANRLSLNVDKTEFVVFRPPRHNSSIRFTLKLNGTVLHESPKIKYLGLILDRNLSWKHHIFELRKKLSRAVGILYIISQLGERTIDSAIHLPSNIYRYWTAILDGNIEQLLNEFKLPFFHGKTLQEVI